MVDNAEHWKNQHFSSEIWYLIKIMGKTIEQRVEIEHLMIVGAAEKWFSLNK